MGFNNCWYPTYQNIVKCETEMNFRIRKVTMDILLNLDASKPELKVCAVNNNKDLVETIMWNKPDNDKGWVPYFNMYYDSTVDAEIRFAQIDPSFYGKPIENLFPS